MDDSRKEEQDEGEETGFSQEEHPLWTGEENGDARPTQEHNPHDPETPPHEPSPINSTSSHEEKLPQTETRQDEARQEPEPQQEQTQSGIISPFGWKVIAAALVTLLAISISSGGFGLFNDANPDELNSQEATQRAIDFINTNLLEPGITASVVGIEEVGDLYAINIEVLGQQLTSYVSKDGKLFFPQGVDIDSYQTLKTEIEALQAATEGNNTTTEDTLNPTAEATTTPPPPTTPSDPNALVIDLSDEPTTTAKPTNGKLAITAKKYRFDPPTITLTQGEPVTLTLKSTDITHSFNLPEFNITRQIPAGGEVTIEFTPTKKGTFTFFSTSNNAMKGELIVE